jgi:hypothetical protein
MNTNIKVFLLCPVPEDQKPINVYIGLKENPLTSWTTLSNRNYDKKILSLASFLLLGICFFRLPFLQEINYFLEWTLINCFLSITFLIFLLIVIFFRWKQVEQDFNQPRLFYEEGSWYDGQMWEKPFAILKNDRLISTQKVQPILQRVSRSIFTLVSLNLVFLLLFEVE